MYILDSLNPIVFQCLNLAYNYSLIVTLNQYVTAIARQTAWSGVKTTNQEATITLNWNTLCHNVPLGDHITPYCVNFGLIKLPDTVNYIPANYFMIMHLIDKKSLNLILCLVSEQRNYAAQSASLQNLNPKSFRINVRTFCSIIIGCYYNWNDIILCTHNKLENNLKKHTSFTLLSINNFSILYLFTMCLLFPLLYLFSFILK